MASTFYEGDLQSGISLALRDSKFVACFIRDDGDESSRWEDDYLGDAQVKSALTDRAITLRIQAGSQGAGFLTAYYPVPVVPALLLIHNGVLTLDLRSGQDKAAFKAGVLTTLVAASVRSSTSSTIPETLATSSLAEETSASSLSSREQPTINPQNPSVSSSSQAPMVQPRQTETTNATRSSVAQEDATASPTSSGSSNQSVVQRLLEERRLKLEVDKKQKEAAEKADRKAKAKARKESTKATPDSAKAKQAIYAQEQRKFKAEVQSERERILRQIEQDKADRKEKEERRKALAEADAGGKISEDVGGSDKDFSGNGVAKWKIESRTEASKSKDCAVQVRLFDGTTIRSKFNIQQTLTNLREWVEKERSDDVPFTFRQILSPMPNRSLTISEEKDTLMQLGFVPSATLVMVPVKGSTAAYTDADPSVMSRIAALPLNAVAAGTGLVSGALGTFLGFGQAVHQQGEPSAQTPLPVRSESQPSTSESGINVRTLRQQREERNDHQLYNGNQINVEPRNEDTDKDK